MTTDEGAGARPPGARRPPSARRPSGPGAPAGFSAVRHAPLLEQVVADALDPAYADAAARRRDRPPRARSATMALLLVGGLVVGLTVGRERTEAPAAEQARTALVGDARQRTAIVEGLSTQIEQLRQDTSRLQATVLASTQQGRAVAQQRADLSAAAGETAVTGPGVSVTVDDAADTTAGRGSAERRPDGSVVTGRVTDRNLQDVVNALWAAGAEAVSVGGIRLSPTTAIRTAGETVLADYRPLTAPYVLLAIGDPAALEQEFRSTGAGILARLGQQGSPVRITRRTDLRLPAASGTDSRVAAPLPSTRTPGAHS
jgi:uncharacterized protein YlxW (UPF0749 family)